MKKISFLKLFVLLAMSTPCFADTIHVPGDQPTIQTGIDAAVNGDIVLVAPGSYLENVNFNGKVIILKSSGGSEVTTIDGGYSADPDFGSTVTFNHAETSDTILDGFTIFNGTGTLHQYTSSQEFLCGGGIFCDIASPTVKSCVFDNNTAHRGGGVSCWQGNMKISDCTFLANYTDSYGSGMDLYKGDAEIEATHFLNNVAASSATLNVWDSTLIVMDCTFFRNGTIYGGSAGIDNIGGSDTIISRCVFEKNTGTAVHNTSSLKMDYC
ncbi:MAG: right-handed parallel beta-helix repeat-containing protein, partial [Planctomycetota bacterium]